MEKSYGVPLNLFSSEVPTTVLRLSLIVKQVNFIAPHRERFTTCNKASQEETKTASYTLTLGPFRCRV